MPKLDANPRVPGFSGLLDQYQTVKTDVDRAATRVLESGWYVLGKEVKGFEEEFAAYVEVSYCVGCASGTEAIALALMALDIGPGDEVITVAMTAVPTATGIAMTGATPVFVDIDDNYLMDPEVVLAKIGPRTKAILPVHLYGQTVAMQRLLEVAAKHGVPVIEDACQAHGAQHRGLKAGSMGVMGCFSFYPTKNLGCYGDGGAVTTNNKRLYQKLLMLRNYGQEIRYIHSSNGINSRLDEIQAAFLRVHLKYLDQWNGKRRQVADWYKKYLSGVVGIPVEHADNHHVYHLYVVETDQRDALMDYLTKNNVSCLIHYPIPVHLQKCFAALGYKQGDLPHTEKAARSILSLPMHPWLTHDQASYTCEIIHEFFKGSHGVAL
ncbi:MAG: DegT/DnrJ/EryC1/StrS family aminotransferase [Desulfovibrionaceae bacterium]|nr:DegT/DnrJ/EryC1/StrS family aminotransferase [Desulfovibrionaceae bacterium]MBF0515152.1 DegT/DnrJ/EryC1/StrS family aminotransferase [Desulfovibrionaceae bacterium]